MSREHIEKIQSELEEGMGLAKCRRCGCMKTALDELESALAIAQDDDYLRLRTAVGRFNSEMEGLTAT